MSETDADEEQGAAKLDGEGEAGPPADEPAIDADMDVKIRRAFEDYFEAETDARRATFAEVSRGRLVVTTQAGNPQVLSETVCLRDALAAMATEYSGTDRPVWKDGRLLGMVRTGVAGMGEAISLDG